MPFDLPRNTIVPVDRVDVRLDPRPHPFETANRPAIEENWRRETAVNPALFDGQVVLLSSLAYAGGSLAGRCHAIRYSTFLHWRRHRETAPGEHAFAHAMLVSRDGALVAVRMGGHTANAGRVYFAAGSFEPVDFPDGSVDLHGNMAREVREETGLSIDAVPREDGFHFISMPNGTVIFRRYFVDAAADDIAEAIRAFVAGETDPEIDGPVVIRGRDDLPAMLALQMPPLIDWHFANPWAPART